jgi:uncharacterized membrane protein YphA (DoxX/SURF4 family)
MTALLRAYQGKPRGMVFQSLILTAFRLLLGAIFLASSVGKVGEHRRFAATVAALKLIPRTWVRPIALALIGIELVVAVLLLLGWRSQSVSALCGLLLAIFTTAMGISLLRGYTDLECGCFGTRYTEKINLRLIYRNLVLIVVALCIMFGGGGLLTMDSYWPSLKRLFMTGMLLPFMLVFTEALILGLLVHQLYRLLLLIPLEE